MMADRKPMKVVIIETVHVKTDCTSFKSVVQNLTGKESSYSCIVQNRKRSPPPSVNGRSGCGQSWLGGDATSGAKRDYGGAASSHFPVVTRESSFREFERMMMEPPPVEELSKFWDD